jgi:hypothetical protein
MIHRCRSPLERGVELQHVSDHLPAQVNQVRMGVPQTGGLRTVQDLRQVRVETLLVASMISAATRTRGVIVGHGTSRRIALCTWHPEGVGGRATVVRTKCCACVVGPDPERHRRGATRGSSSPDPRSSV